MTRLSFRLGAAMLGVAALAACKDEPLAMSNVDPVPSLQAAVVASPHDVEAIRQILATFDQAWAAGDYATYAEQYAHVQDWVGPTGVVLTDPAAIVGLYRNLFTGIFANTVRASTIRGLVFLTGTLAVLDIEARGTGFGMLPPGVVPWQPGIIRVLERNILEKRGGKWRIIRHQQTSVAPGVP